MNRFTKLALVVTIALTAFVMIVTAEAEAGCYGYSSGYGLGHTPPTADRPTA